jgi:hypothetical protein
LESKKHKQLIKNFPKDVVKPAPKGKFGNYVPHHLYTQRLVDVIPGEYNFTFEELRDKNGAMVGAKCTLEIKELGTVQEVGDVDMNALNRNITESEVLKLAVSDGIKRCCMRFGIGLELWTGGVTEEEHYSGDGETKPQMTKTKEVNNITEKSAKEFEKSLYPVNNSQEINSIIADMEPDADKRKTYKKEAYDKAIADDYPTEVNDWDDQQVKTYLEIFADIKKKDKDLTDTFIKKKDKDLTDTLGEVIDKSDELKVCPKCSKTDDIVDMREKKSDAPEGSGIKNLPDFMCQQNNKYNPDSNGCGWGGYIGGKDDKGVPEQWL